MIHALIIFSSLFFIGWFAPRIIRTTCKVLFIVGIVVYIFTGRVFADEPFGWVKGVTERLKQENDQSIRDYWQRSREIEQQRKIDELEKRLNELESDDE